MQIDILNFAIIVSITQLLACCIKIAYTMRRVKKIIIVLLLSFIIQTYEY